MATASTQTFTWGIAFIDAMLLALTTAPTTPLFVTPKVHLFSGSTPVNPHSQVSDFTELIASGYQAEALTLSSPGNLSQNTHAVVGTVLFQTGTATPFVADTATGYFIQDAANHFCGGETFARPVPFANPGDFLSLTVLVALNGVTPTQ